MSAASSSLRMKRTIEDWEPEEFASMYAEPGVMDIEPERPMPPTSLAEDNAATTQKLANTIAGWPTYPTPTLMGALRIVALYVDAEFPCTAAMTSSSRACCTPSTRKSSERTQMASTSTRTVMGPSKRNSATGPSASWSWC